MPLSDEEVQDRMERFALAVKPDDKYKGMMFPQILQHKNNKSRCRMVEKMQKRTFEAIIKRRHKELLPDWKDMFAMFWMGFLKGEFVSINDFLYVDRLAPEEKRVLR